MAAQDWPKGPAAGNRMPAHRELDRIARLDVILRNALLTGRVEGEPAELSLSDAMRFAADQLIQVMQEWIVEIWLRDQPPWGTGHGETLRAIVAQGRYGAISRAEPADLILAVMTAGRPLLLEDAAHHPLVRAWVADAYVGPDALAVFHGVPIRHHDTSWGVLAVALPATPSAEHIALLEVFADYLAVTVRVDSVLSQRDLHYESAQAVLREAPLAAAVVSPRDYELILTNPRFDHLLHLSPHAWGQRLDVVLPEHAPALRRAWQLDDVVRTGEPRIMLNMPVRLPEGMSYWDFTSAPIRAADGSIQSIVITGVDVTARVLQSHRQQRAVDIAQERVLQMLALHKISLEVGAKLGQDPMDLLRVILERMALLVDATGGFVLYADHETGDLEVVISAGLAQDYTRTRLKQGEGLAGRVYITGQGQMVTDYRRYPLRSAVFADAPFGAMVAVPMRENGVVIGVIALVQEVGDDGHPTHPHRAQDEGRGSFTTEDIWLLELFATQAAQVIQTARIHQDLERAYQRQRALDRQKDDFLARASHDLRLPLTSVVGFLDLALTALEGGHAAHALVRQAADEAQRLREMLDDMMAQLRQDGTHREISPRAVQLAPIVEEIIRARRKQMSLHGARHRFTVHIPTELAVLADKTSLKEVLENLISNAVKYSPQGGEVVITATVDRQRTPLVATISVSDQGIGIAEDAQQHIFERFMRVDSPLAHEIRGDGIGLYLARQLVESMEGTIWLERSAPGEGSVFAFSLPLANQLSPAGNE